MAFQSKKKMADAPLSSLVKVRSGFTFREALTGLSKQEQTTALAARTDGTSVTRVVQSRDVLRPDGLQADALLAVSSARHRIPVSTEHHLRADDVLLLLKGARPAAALVEASLVAPGQWPVVAVSLLAVLRPDDPARLDSAFLTWWLNSTPGQQALAARQHGSTVQTLRLTDVESLTVPLPPLSRQQAIAEAAVLNYRTRTLAEEAAASRYAEVERQLLGLLPE